MRYLTAILTLAAITSTLPAQCPATTTFTTLYGGTTYLGSPDPVVGANMFFDLTAAINVTICEMDVNLLDAGNVAGNPVLTGQTTQLHLFIAPTTYVNNHATPSVWVQLGTATLTVAAANQPSRAVFNPPVLFPAGTWGVALQHMPVTTGTVTGPIHPYYTNPAVTPTPLVHSDTYLTLTAGAGQNVAFAGGLATPRIINTNIRYTPDPTAAGFSTFGSGCYAPNELTLTPDARPVLGQTINMVTDNIPVPTTPAGFLFLGLGRVNPSVELTALGMTGCYQHIVPSVTNFFLVMQSSEAFPVGIPNNSALTGLFVYAQSATLTPGVNTAGILSSNGVELEIGT